MNGPRYEDGWPIAEELLKELPSNQLQSHKRVKYIGDTLYPSEGGGRKGGREGGREGGEGGEGGREKTHGVSPFTCSQ